jgi:hypothetical protein
LPSLNHFTVPYAIVIFLVADAAPRHGRAGPLMAMTMASLSQHAGQAGRAASQLPGGPHRMHRGLGRYPEHHPWEAVQGYLDVHDAAESPARNADRP